MLGAEALHRFVAREPLASKPPRQDEDWRENAPALELETGRDVFVFSHGRSLKAPSGMRQNKFVFCNGPQLVNPFFAPLPLPGSCFCTGSAQGCRLMALEKERAGPILMRGVAWLQRRRLLANLRPDPIHRPGRNATSGRGAILPENRRVLLLSRRSGVRDVSLFG